MSGMKDEWVPHAAITRGVSASVWVSVPVKNQAQNSGGWRMSPHFVLGLYRAGNVLGTVLAP
ncbi:hypothetical protein GCM10009716_21250 [Streptomyces sodiiphilus]|uniref:Uncharacterized protein n=1 Tax=Streptomyces sodiiphilus TaxID=226217 RepID=A0ABN2P6V4_9ACTN